MAKRRRRTINVIGITLKVSGRYVCWNSFQSCWFLGPRRLSEVFQPVYFDRTNAHLSEALTRFPTAVLKYEEV